MRDSFDTKSEFPAIAQTPQPPMKPNSILRFPPLLHYVCAARRVVITEHEVDIISRKGKAGEGGEGGKEERRTGSPAELCDINCLQKHLWSFSIPFISGVIFDFPH